VIPTTTQPTAVPAPGQAALPAPSAAALLRRNATDPERANRPAILFGEHRWTHRQFLEESARWARLFRAARVDGRPLHIGVLLDNTPDYLFAFGGAALAGAAIVGLNHTRQGEHLLRDITHTDCVLVVTEPAHLDRLRPIAAQLPMGEANVVVSHRHPAEGDREVAAWAGRDLDEALDDAALSFHLGGGSAPIDAGSDRGDGGSNAVDGDESDPSTTWALIFTSGTSDAPKAVICSQRRLLQTGARLSAIMQLGPNDVGYICMPLFHSNAVMVGWLPSLVAGCSVALARKFSASGWLPDIRRYGATYFNYTGKPLAYVLAQPERDDDADNSLRIAFGNEGSPEVVEAFGRRFGVEVIDAFGATEGGIAVSREGVQKPGAMGVAPAHIKIVDDDGNELPAARFDEHGRLANADECVGEIVNVNGAGPFEGYYNNREANEKTTRNGWYWSGDLGYVDDDRHLFFAGRNADWIRVDGENFPAQPIETALGQHPDVVIASVYGVPDEQAGDQVMAALVLKDGSAFDGASFAAWLDDLEDIGPKWRPRYVRIAEELPTTGTNKIVKRTLAHQQVRRDRVGDDQLFVRRRGDDAYRPFTVDDEQALHAAFVQAGRERFWDL
jgi:fatty-acyl-CoA synthase